MIPVRWHRLVSPQHPAPKCLRHRPRLPLPPLPCQPANPDGWGNRTAPTRRPSPANQRNRARYQKRLPHQTGQNLPHQTDPKKLPNQARWPTLTHSRRPRSSPGSTRSPARPGPIQPNPIQPNPIRPNQARP
jgi:hypothetical protein